MKIQSYQYNVSIQIQHSIESLKTPTVQTKFHWFIYSCTHISRVRLNLFRTSISVFKYPDSISLCGKKNSCNTHQQNNGM